jgi:hypothetical protein
MVYNDVCKAVFHFASVMIPEYFVIALDIDGFSIISQQQTKNCHVHITVPYADVNASKGAMFNAGDRFCIASAFASPKSKTKSVATILLVKEGDMNMTYRIDGSERAGLSQSQDMTTRNAPSPQPITTPDFCQMEISHEQLGKIIGTVTKNQKTTKSVSISTSNGVMFRSKSTLIAETVIELNGRTGKEHMANFPSKSFDGTITSSGLSSLIRACPKSGDMVRMSFREGTTQKSCWMELRVPLGKHAQALVFVNVVSGVDVIPSTSFYSPSLTTSGSPANSPTPQPIDEKATHRLTGSLSFGPAMPSALKHQSSSPMTVESMIKREKEEDEEDEEDDVDNGDDFN